MYAGCPALDKVKLSVESCCLEELPANVQNRNNMPSKMTHSLSLSQSFVSKSFSAKERLGFTCRISADQIWKECGLPSSCTSL